MEFSSTESKLLKVKEAAACLAICERKLWQLVKIGQVKSVRIDRAVRFDPTDLQDFIRRAKGVTQ